MLLCTVTASPDAYASARPSADQAMHETASRLASLRGAPRLPCSSLLLLVTTVPSPPVIGRHANCRTECQILGGYHARISNKILSLTCLLQGGISRHSPDSHRSPAPAAEDSREGVHADCIGLNNCQQLSIIRQRDSCPTVWQSADAYCTGILVSQGPAHRALTMSVSGLIKSEQSFSATKRSPSIWSLHSRVHEALCVRDVNT